MKNKTLRRSTLSIALVAGLAGGAWQNANACATDPVISGVCIMAATSLGDFNRTYYEANGRLLSVSQYSPLFSLLGATYGGNGTSTFGIPDLRGRVVVGAGQGAGLPLFTPGQAMGQLSTTLTIAQMPAHTHAFSGAANLGGVNVSGAASGLQINASANANTNNPSNAYPGTTAALTKIYSTDAPTVTMNAGAIGGNLNLTIASGATAPVNGTNGVAGGNLPVPTMQPSLVMKYFIAWSGTYPSRD